MKLFFIVYYGRINILLFSHHKDSATTGESARRVAAKVVAVVIL